LWSTGVSLTMLNEGCPTLYKQISPISTTLQKVTCHNLHWLGLEWLLSLGQ